MIATGSECPRWIRELVRFLPLKNLLFVYGNILDLVSYPIQRSGSDEIYWTESDLPGFFERFLSGLQYEIIGFCDPIDGLTFPTSTPEMENVYKRLQTGRPISVSASEERNSQPERAYSSPNIQTSPRTAPIDRSKMTETRLPAQSEAALSRKGGTPDLNHSIDGISVALMNKTVPCAFVLNFASRLVGSPTNLGKPERDLMMKILKASLLSKEVIHENSRWNNVLILICDKLNDLPTFLYLNNPHARSIHIERPDTTDRIRFMRRTYRAFYGMETDPAEPRTELVSLFAALTEGMTHYEMSSLVRLSRKEEIPISKIQNICERFKYGITESEWDKIDKARLKKAEEFIKFHIKGQEAAVARVLDIIKRAKIGLAAGTSHKSSRPRGVLFFAGPTGVGKTETAKALAKLLFGAEDRLIRFDMSEYSAEQADQRLLGSPPGYVGYEEGGQLTKAVKERPFSILLFDEIEKAHGSIFDKFLQILDDGRLTDGKGETVYFSECIIIFTSNLGTVTRLERFENSSHALVTPEMPYAHMKEVVLKAIRDHFNFALGRPEILNRFGDNFVVFDFIRPPVDEEIVNLLLTKLAEAAKEDKKIELVIELPVQEKLISLARENLQHGGRGIRNVIDAALINPLNRLLFDEEVEAGATVRLRDLIDNGEDAPYRYELR